MKMRMTKTRYTLGSGWQMEGMTKALEEVTVHEEMAELLRETCKEYRWDGGRVSLDELVRTAEVLLAKVGG